MPTRPIHVLIWNEYLHERTEDKIRAVYPDGIHSVIVGFLSPDERLIVRTATFQEEDLGLSQALLDETDVLIWWGHAIHHLVPREAVERVCRRVLDGMGFIALHSAVFSRPYEQLIGGVMNSAYREVGERERVWVVNPAHEITRGLPECFEIKQTEVYREPSGRPLPEELLFISWYQGGEAAISGGCYYRGRGRVFFFTPGHEEYPIYYDPSVQQVIHNAVYWAYNPWRCEYAQGPVPPYEKLD